MIDQDSIVATWQTLGRGERLAAFQRRFNMAHFKLVVVDEAHHSVTNTYVHLAKTL
jgi:superfamily II DNA or RNA helicase